MVKALELNFLVPFKHVTLKYDQLIIMAFTNRAMHLALELSETGHVPPSVLTRDVLCVTREM